MGKEFTKDIDLSTKPFRRTLKEEDLYKFKTDRDERMWVNLYFIGARLEAIKWILIVVMTIFIFKFFF